MKSLAKFFCRLYDTYKYEEWCNRRLREAQERIEFLELVIAHKQTDKDEFLRYENMREEMIERRKKKDKFKSLLDSMRSMKK